MCVCCIQASVAAAAGTAARSAASARWRLRLFASRAVAWSQESTARHQAFTISACAARCVRAAVTHAGPTPASAAAAATAASAAGSSGASSSAASPSMPHSAFSAVVRRLGAPSARCGAKRRESC